MAVNRDLIAGSMPLRARLLLIPHQKRRALLALCLLGCLASLVPGRQHPAGVRQQGDANRGEGDTVAVTLEQFGAKLALQHPDLLAQRWLETGKAVRPRE